MKFLVVASLLMVLCCAVGQLFCYEDKKFVTQPEDDDDDRFREDRFKRNVALNEWEDAGSYNSHHTDKTQRTVNIAKRDVLGITTPDYVAAAAKRNVPEEQPDSPTSSWLNKNKREADRFKRGEPDSKDSEDSKDPKDSIDSKDPDSEKDDKKPQPPADHGRSKIEHPKNDKPHHKPPHHPKPSNHKHEGHEAQDFALEVESMKLPIISHFLRYISSMYNVIHSYDTVDGEGGNKVPSFYHHHKGPKFDVLCKNHFYEVRKYHPSKWVKTTINFETEAGDPHLKAFNRLHEYLRGKNDKKENIDMAVPVIVHFRKTNDPEPKKNCDMGFYIPADIKNPPKPTNPLVRIYDAPSKIYYVKMFGGLVLKSVWKPKGIEFVQELKAFHQEIDLSFGGLDATYNKPSRLIHRHNEILFKVADDKKDPSKYCSIK